jgi:rSAM/selenodomain-associated transferase 1
LKAGVAALPPWRRRQRAGIAGAPRAAAFRWRLVIMAKAAIAGKIKTRLAREIGTVEATRFARQAGAALLARMGADPRWQTVLAITPDHVAAGPRPPPGFVTVGQGCGDLGQRMQRLFRVKTAGPVIIIGSDIPGITPRHIAKAFALLGGRDAVFGPALDGGYWLVGLRRRPRLLQPFQPVRWSSAEALADTLANLAGRSIGFVASLADVDDGDAYRRASAICGRRVLPPG